MSLILLLFCCESLGQGISPDDQTDAASAGTPREVSLLIAEYPPGSTEYTYHVLARYRFLEGQLKRREGILTGPEHNVRFAFKGDRTYLERYAITRWGDIIDVHTKRVLHEGFSESIAALDGKRVILRRENIAETGTFVFDLGTEKHEKLPEPNKWTILFESWGPASLSPDGTKSISGGNSVVLHTSPGQSKKLTPWFACQMHFQSSSLGRIPMLWLDNETVLTQSENGKLVTVKLDGTVSPLVDIPCKELPISPPTLERDPEGRIIYCCVSSYVIDVKNRRYAPLRWYKYGHGFDIAQEGRGSSYVVRYRGVEIGRQQMERWSGRSIAGHFAVICSPGGRGPTHGVEVKVWSALSCQWTTLKPSGLRGPVGWLDDSL